MGIGPHNWLKLRSSHCNDESEKIPDGIIVPVNLLLSKNNIVKFFIAPGNEGREPMNLLPDKLIVSICVISIKILFGSDPLNPQK